MVERGDGSDLARLGRSETPADGGARQAFVAADVIEEEAPADDGIATVQRQIRVVEDGVHLGETGKLAKLGAEVADGVLVQSDGARFGGQRREVGLERIEHDADRVLRAREQEFRFDGRHAYAVLADAIAQSANVGLDRRAAELVLLNELQLAGHGGRLSVAVPIAHDSFVSVVIRNAAGKDTIKRIDAVIHASGRQSTSR